MNLEGALPKIAIDHLAELSGEILFLTEFTLRGFSNFFLLLSDVVGIGLNQFLTLKALKLSLLVHYHTRVLGDVIEHEVP